MVKQLLLCAGVAMCFSAYAADLQKTENPLSFDKAAMVKDANVYRSVKAKINDGSANRPNRVVANQNVHWKRPAGQFWGTGYSPETGGWYYFTPLVLRPWIDYEFVNESKIIGTPSWDITHWNSDTKAYETTTMAEKNATVSYTWGPAPAAPLLKYNNIAYPLMYDANEIAKNSNGEEMSIDVLSNENIVDSFGVPMYVSSHYYSVFTRNAGADEGDSGLISYSGAKGYEGMEDVESDGWWAGTNASGYNAIATRFEKPDKPYLIKSVHWQYIQEGNVLNNVPLKAYVFKTANAAKEETFTNSQTGEQVVRETLELGEFIADSESFVPASSDLNDNGFLTGVVDFKFVKKNTVTGAETNVDLEIDDDITIIVTGYNVDLGNGASIRTPFSNDTFDEGYGNLGFLGSLEETEDGSISYSMRALKDFFVNPLPNTVGGVLIDVDYPWLHSAYTDQESTVKLPNEGETTQEVQGLQYDLFLMSTSMTEDFDITFDGEEECEWLSVVDVYDEMKANSDEEEEFTGVTAIEFEAAPNPDDESRVCHVKVSIPAATYEITFLQGSKADDNAVEVVTANGKVQYFDLTGRRVSNPEKGVYVKVCGNKSEKVIL